MEWETAPEAFDAPLPKAEPEDDPLGGDASPSQEQVTVPPPVTATPTAGAVKLVDLDHLLQKPSRIPSNDLEVESPQGSHISNGSRDAIASATGQLPTTTSTTKSTDRPMQKARRKQYTPTPQETQCHPEVIEIKEEPDDVLDTNYSELARCLSNCSEELFANYITEVPVGNGSEENSIEDELSELLIMKPKGSRSAPRSRANVRSVSRPRSQRLGVSSASKALRENPVLPGSNLLLYPNPDGRYLARKASSMSAQSSTDSGRAAVSFTNRTGPGHTSASNGAPIGQKHIKSGKGSRVIVCDLDSDNNLRVVAERRRRNFSKETVNIIVEQQEAAPLNETASTAQIVDEPQPFFDDKLPVPEAEPVKSVPPVSKRKPVWPPPVYRRKKKPKIPDPLPLSGSWTNPNPQPSTSGSTEKAAQPGSDPLAGSVQDTINDTTTSTRVPRSSRCATFSRSIQCSLTGEGVPLPEITFCKEPECLKRPMVTRDGKRVMLDAQSKMILYNVYKYFELRKSHYNLSYSVPEAVGNATGIKVVTLRKIMSEALQTCDKDDHTSLPSFRALSKQRSRAKVVVSNLVIDSSLRRYIHEAFLKKKQCPPAQQLLRRFQSGGFRRNLRVGLKLIQDRVKRLGFLWVRATRRKALIEGPSIRAWRYEYLNRMKTCVEEKKNIVFTFIVHLRELSLKQPGLCSWVVIDGDEEIKENCRVLTICHAADGKGFIDGALFHTIGKLDVSTDARSKWHLNWLEQHVLKKIPEGSVVVLAHDRFHGMADAEMKPGFDKSKKQIIEWLKNRVAGDVDEALPKSVLLEKVRRFPVEQKYVVDSMVEYYNRTAVHLPTAHRELNPVEYVWDAIRVKWNDKGKLTFPDGFLQEMSPMFQDLADSKLQEAFQRVRECEDTFRRNDPRLETAQEAALKKLGGLWSSPLGPHLDEGEPPDVDLNGDDSDNNFHDPDMNGDNPGMNGNDSDMNDDNSDTKSNGVNSDTKSNDADADCGDSDSSKSSNSASSGSDSDSDSDSSDDSSDSDSSDSSSSDSEDGAPPSEHTSDPNIQKTE